MRVGIVNLGASQNQFEIQLIQIIEKNGFRITETQDNMALLILLAESVTDSLLSIVEKANGNRLPVVVICQELGFQKKVQLYRMGVLSCMMHTEFNQVKFEKYLDSIKREYDNHAALKKMKIAVVDDSLFSLEVIKGFFNLYDVEQVTYFQKSSDFIPKMNHFDLYLIDLVMPEIDGEELIHRIREANDRAIIILITTYGDGKAIPHCLSIGANDFIIKPLEVKLFMMKIHACIHQFKLQELNDLNTEKLYEMATRDALTGIYNRAYFYEMFQKMTFEAMRTQKSLSLILVDLDNFKMVNDKFGHLSGDSVLKSVARIIEKNIRASDFVSRWGGEEFVVMLNPSDIHQASLVAEKIRMAIESHYFLGLGHVTASFGVTQWQAGDTEDAAFKRLDNSLYLAKLTGKNKVITNEEIGLKFDGLPTSIEWGPFFKSGLLELDEEHHELILASNEIIYHCFDASNTSYMIRLFKKLIEAIVVHFENEEKILKSYAYSKLNEHKICHEDLKKKALILLEGLIKSQFTAVHVAQYLIQDVVVGHLIKSDFEFFELFSKPKQ